MNECKIVLKIGPEVYLPRIRRALTFGIILVSLFKVHHQDESHIPRISTNLMSKFFFRELFIISTQNYHHLIVDEILEAINRILYTQSVSQPVIPWHSLAAAANQQLIN